MPTRTGLILYVHNYEQCVDFYLNRIGLPVLFTTPELTCFEFGGSYLMVELDDRPDLPVRSGSPASCLRFNVPDVRAFAAELKSRGVDVDYQEHSWGTVAKFLDPEGNLCAFKDDETFERQIRDHELKRRHEAE